jgi:probable rRNA maturation factor
MPGASESRSTSAALAQAPLWLVLDVAQEADGWSSFQNVDALIETAGAAVASHPRFRGHEPREACVGLSDDKAVQDLNHRYRGKNKPTNVLSFPAVATQLSPDSGPRALGDIVLALETVEREAQDQQLPLPHHFQHLVVHGLLHLLGFDHETEADAAVMEGLEIEILAGLGIANPYVEQVVASDQ